MTLHRCLLFVLADRRLTDVRVARTPPQWQYCAVRSLSPLLLLQIFDSVVRPNRTRNTVRYHIVYFAALNHVVAHPSYFPGIDHHSRQRPLLYAPARQKLRNGFRFTLLALSVRHLTARTLAMVPWRRHQHGQLSASIVDQDGSEKLFCAGGTRTANSARR